LKQKVIRLARDGGEEEALFESTRVLAGGGVVLFPTETVYGLGGDGANPLVVEKIYRIKKRSGDKPLIRLLADQSEIRQMLTEDGQDVLLRRYWPGPLTVILRRPGGETCGYRLPGHHFVRRMIEGSGVEMVATSANRSGEPAITDAAAACREFGGRVDLILDGGRVSGSASTVLDLSVSPPCILREGPVTRSEIEACLGYEVRL
jgi:L-threonylcarbamoyladenylate synthase